MKVYMRIFLVRLGAVMETSHGLSGVVVIPSWEAAERFDGSEK
jgi:hypothetical protein